MHKLDLKENTEKTTPHPLVQLSRWVGSRLCKPCGCRLFFSPSTTRLGGRARWSAPHAATPVMSWYGVGESPIQRKIKITSITPHLASSARGD